jgi:hypothetical protein
LVTPSFAQDSSLTGGVILNPAGLYTTYSRRVAGAATGPGLSVYNTFLFYSDEFGLGAQYTTDPAILEVHTQVGFEPGVFQRAGTRGRKARWRAVWRTQANLNLKLDSFWLYSRTTALLRYRNFVEVDTINKIEIAREWSVEEAFAPFVRILGSPGRAGLWGYTEYTVGAIRDVGIRTNRVSAGLLTEHWPTSAISLNVDLFWSFAEPLSGPGAILIYFLGW